MIERLFDAADDAREWLLRVLARLAYAAGRVGGILALWAGIVREPLADGWSRGWRRSVEGPEPEPVPLGEALGRIHAAIARIDPATIRWVRPGAPASPGSPGSPLVPPIPHPDDAKHSPTVHCAVFAPGPHERARTRDA